MCTYVLQQTARGNFQDFKPETIHTVLRDFYVDDCVKSFQSKVQATEMGRDPPELLSKGGFCLRKWLSKQEGSAASCAGV